MTLAGVDGFPGVSASPSLSLMIAAGCVLAGATRAAGRAPGPPLSSSWRGVPTRQNKVAPPPLSSLSGGLAPPICFLLPHRRERQKDNCCW
jgi:hypothetical protein